MKNIFIILLTILPIHALAIGNLCGADYYGNWKSHGVVVKGETQQLIISKDMATYFERNINGKLQKYTSSPELYSKHQDIIVFKYNDESGDLHYKLVLSGWKVKKNFALYGTLYMYFEGVQFNGIPVSFTKQQKIR